MTIMRRAGWIASGIAAAVCAIGAGCAGDGKSGAGGKPGGEVIGECMDQLSGTLKSGYMGIGGEHTGWVILVPEGSREQQVEVDVSKVRAAAKERDGKAVRAFGVFSEKRYLERGPVSIFVIDRFE